MWWEVNRDGGTVAHNSPEKTFNEERTRIASIPDLPPLQRRYVSEMARLRDKLKSVDNAFERADLVSAIDRHEQALPTRLDGWVGKVLSASPRQVWVEEQQRYRSGAAISLACYGEKEHLCDDSVFGAPQSVWFYTATSDQRHRFIGLLPGTGTIPWNRSIINEVENPALWRLAKTLKRGDIVTFSGNQCEIVVEEAEIGKYLEITSLTIGTNTATGVVRDSLVELFRKGR